MICAPDIQNPSFIKNEIKQVSPEEAACMPWPPGGPGGPCQCRKFLCGKNIDICPGKKKYIPPPRAKSVRPVAKFCLPCVPFADTTVYRGSYFPNSTTRPDSYLPKDQLCFSSCPMERRTIQKLSYPGWYNVEPPCPKVPCEREWWHGPIQDITTHKHDYVPKPFSKVVVTRRPHNIASGCGPSQTCTTFRASFKAHPIGKVEKVIPAGNLCFSSCPMETNTTQKMSYQPNPVGEKEYLPWLDKGKYKPPCQKVENNTVYRMSYEPPGMVVDDECVDCANKMGGCYCEYPGQCFGLSDPRPELYPRAAC